MDRIRAFGEWIAKHRMASVAATLAIVGALGAWQYVARTSSGRLSEPLARGVIVDAVYGIGTVTANKRFSINPLVGETVGHSFVKEGDRVKKGARLMVTSEGNTIVAPFDGVANFFPYRNGENVYMTSPMMVFTDLGDRYVVVSMEQQGALRVDVGQSAKLSFDSLRHSTFEGKVSAVYSYNSQFLARIDAVELPKSILPDMTCDVAITVATHKDALLIPAVAFENGKVWVKRGLGIPRAVPVKLGVIDGTQAEVVEGDLQPGDRVLIREKASL